MPTDPVPETTPPTTAVAHLLDVLDDVPNFLFGEDVAAACAMLEKPRAICAHWLMAAVILRASRSGMIWMPLNARWLAGRRAMADLPETTPPTTAVAHLLDVLDDVPNFLFGEDVAAACAMLERSPLVSEAEAARHLRTLVDGCRDTPGFPFGDDLDAAERALARWEACNG